MKNRDILEQLVSDITVMDIEDVRRLFPEHIKAIDKAEKALEIRGNADSVCKLCKCPHDSAEECFMEK